MLSAQSIALAQAEIVEPDVATSGVCLRLLRYGLPCLGPYPGVFVLSAKLEAVFYAYADAAVVLKHYLAVWHVYPYRYVTVRLNGVYGVFSHEYNRCGDFVGAATLGESNSLASTLNEIQVVAVGHISTAVRYTYGSADVHVAATVPLCLCACGYCHKRDECQ